MAIDAISSKQFDQFVSFAQPLGEKSTDIARFSTDALNNRTITAGKDDSVGKLFRGAVAKQNNNDIRAVFRDSVVEMFGGESKIPESVKKAMLLADYGKGKPLTARRILAVKTAVDLVKAEYTTAVDKALADLRKNSKFSSLSPQDQAALEKAVSAAVKSSVGNKAALESVMKNMQFIVMDGARNIRSPESVAKKCDAVVANFKELQSLAKGNSEFIAAGTMLLDELHGKSVPDGLIGKISDMCKKVDISAIKGLSEKSSAVDLDAAAKQFRQGIQKVMVDSGAEKALTGGDELEPCRNFAGALLVARLGSSGLGKMDRAMNSDTAQQLVNLYNTIYDGYFDKDTLYVAEVEAVKVEANARLKFLNALKFAGDISRGVAANDTVPVDEFKGDVDYGKIRAGVILQDIMNDGKAQVVKDRDAYIGSVVTGDGSGAAVMRGLYENRLGPAPLGPKDIMNTSGSRIASAMMNITICGECRSLAIGKQSSFEKDVGRQNVSLGNGVKLSKKFEEAREQLTQFVTKNPNAKYADLDSKTRNKVHIAMAILNQEAEKAVYDGYPSALDPKGKQPMFAVLDSGTNDSRELQFDIDSDGGFDLSLKGEKDIAVLVDGKSSIMLGEGSKVSARLSYTISGREIDRLSDLDFSKVDETGVRRTFDDKNLDNRFELAPKQFAPEFQIDPGKTTCKVGYFATLN